MTYVDVQATISPLSDPYEVPIRWWQLTRLEHDPDAIAQTNGFATANPPVKLADS
jgi:hypothetical protein